MKHLRIAVVVAVIMSGGCATPRDLTPEEMQSLQPLSCTSKGQCDQYWQRIQAWIASNSRWRIQTANDVLIQTFGPGASSTDLAYTAIKNVNADGSATISFRAACDNIFGCHPEPYRALAALKAFATKN